MPVQSLGELGVSVGRIAAVESWCAKYFRRLALRRVPFSVSICGSAT